MRETEWRVIKVLGEGGQGTVQLVHPIQPGAIDELVATLRTLAGGTYRVEDFEPLKVKLVEDLVRVIDGNFIQGAKKQLKGENEESRARLALEAKVYETISSPNLLRILDKSPRGDWIVTEYQPNGTLEQRLPEYRGNVQKALTAIRPLVAVLAELHSKNFVHRDFKPGNIFVGRRQQLVLGDAGLAFYLDDTGTRRSQAYENVGTRDYMPAWAYSRRTNIQPTFDVFSVGKVVWSMIAGEPTCPLWYVNKKPHDLQLMFPTRTEMLWVRALFGKCVVEEESQMRVRDGGDLLKEIDLILDALDAKAIPPRVVRESLTSCRICFVGLYKVDNSGHKSTLGRCLKCDKCGHLEFFAS